MPSQSETRSNCFHAFITSEKKSYPYPLDKDSNGLEPGGNTTSRQGHALRMEVKNKQIILPRGLSLRY
jgi:hypothetical protein